MAAIANAESQGRQFATRHATTPKLPNIPDRREPLVHLVRSGNAADAFLVRHCTDARTTFRAREPSEVRGWVAVEFIKLPIPLSD